MSHEGHYVTHMLHATDVSVMRITEHGPSDDNVSMISRRYVVSFRRDRVRA